MVFDSEKQPIVSLGQAGDSASGGISSLKEPLIKEKHHSPEDYSVLAAIFLCFSSQLLELYFLVTRLVLLLVPLFLLRLQ
ncbi:hypothetical protein Bca52824_017665 [Brassica carinata]|uniref:Uncharacterized protein n=1 Tax=Brassica carinata TaxID=52824 RepID=A0A8X8AXP6_BRACI|nr:hypothetical protein Bca52824_017665 [Brassica carinata]